MPSVGAAGDADSEARRARRAHLLMLVIVAAASAALWQGERIPANDGMGFDGVTYAAIVRDPAIALHDKYYLYRALPSWTVRASLSGLGLPITGEWIIRGFLVLNTTLLLVAATLWRPVADKLDLTINGRWLGFIGLFVNFAVLRMAFYYPVFTDTTALTLGMLLAFASLTDRQWLVALTVLAATFTWPVGALLGAALLLWPLGQPALPPGRSDARMATVAGAGLALLFLMWFVWLYVWRGQTVRASHMAVPVVKGVVWVGIVGAMAYIFLTVGRLLEGIDLRYVLTAIRSIRPPGLALAVAAMIPARVLAAMFGEKAPVLTARRYIGDVILLGSSRPMLFAVSAIVYFGPLLLLLLHPAVRARFFAGIRALGPGWCLFILGVVGLSLNSESRHSIFGYPAVVILLAAAASQAGISARVTWCIAVLAVALSKLWLRINLEPQNMVDTTVPATAWNYRRYFMNHGPWMSNEAYVLHVVVVAIAAVAVWAALRTRTSRESPARS